MSCAVPLCLAYSLSNASSTVPHLRAFGQDHGCFPLHLHQPTCLLGARRAFKITEAMPPSPPTDTTPLNITLSRPKRAYLGILTGLVPVVEANDAKRTEDGRVIQKEGRRIVRLNGV